ncbi:MAG: hypothetical protein Unbinned202contig1002_32 [Prokaryotic dsDNA virus sp.]|jgi:hypothetical protein|nr:MAG: hypothetical protein Unbinned202contig1002_32 [Prokaryotic dsDNA virus sp.]|tara:strand:+ start:14092 stop:14235 length:144 start_codon:yes stop_codon:yes gene_type:complete
MIVMNIAEWIANIFILGIACLIWAIAIFGFITILSISNKLIKDFIND